jgi:hypothetical protein
MSGATIGLVCFRQYQGHQLSLVTALVVEDQIGTLWAYPEDADITRDPVNVGAIMLERRHLEAQPPVLGPDELPRYIYRVVFNAPPQPRFPPSIHDAGKSRHSPTKAVH